LVERQPSKLNVAGSNPVSRSGRETRSRPLASHVVLNDDGKKALVAQSVERVLGKDEVTSSILVEGSTTQGRD
jgi:hypothetical protein